MKQEVEMLIRKKKKWKGVLALTLIIGILLALLVTQSIFPIIKEKSITGKIMINDAEIPVIVRDNEGTTSAQVTFENDVLTITKEDKKIEFSGVKNNEEIKVGFDDKLEDNQFIESYAIDPSEIKFESAKFTTFAKGNKLYKCKEWNFDEQRCEGNWIKMMDLIPGQEYNFFLTADDPAFGEVLQPNALEGIDTFVNQNSPNTNYGNQTFLVVAESAGNYAGVLIKFNMSSIPSYADITSSKLKLYFYTSPTNATKEINISTRLITSNGWNESNVTWNTRPSYSTQYSDKKALTNNYGWIEFNVTEIVERWVNGSDPNYGIAVIPDTVSVNTEKRFYSSDSSNTTLRPILEINYSTTSAPNITIIWPDNNSQHGDGRIITAYNVTAETSIYDCKLTNSNGTVIDIDSSVITGQLQLFTRTINQEGNYNFYINCTDITGHSAISDITTIYVNSSKADVYGKIQDANGSAVDVNITFYQNGQAKYTSNGTIHSLTVDDGRYNISISPNSNIIKSMNFKNVVINEGLVKIIDIDDPLDNRGYAELYVINPSELNFTDATVTLTAKGNMLYKCKDWNFTQQECYGSWNKLMNLVPGQQYTFTLTAEDPGFLEVNQPNSTVGKDAFLWENNPAKNYGASNYIGVDNENVKSERGLLWFNLSNISSSATINSAVLELYQTANGGSAFNILVYRINNSWNEGTADGTTNSGTINGTTWNERWYGTNWATAGGDYNGVAYENITVNTTINAWKSWNITSLVQGWVNGTWTNNGLILLPEGSDVNNEKQFASSDNLNSSIWPKLTINYTTLDTNPPAAITNLANKSAGTTWIYWNWTNPADADFNSSIIFIDGNNIINTSNNYYNATGLNPNTSYIITIHTKDTSGNINNTNVSNTASTLVDSIAPSISLVSPANNYTETNNQNVVFTYNVTSDLNITNCTFYLTEPDGYVNKYVNTTITKNINQTFGMQFSYNGDFMWQVNCTDSQNNSTQSELRNITVSIIGLQMSGNTTVQKDAFLWQNNNGKNYGASNYIGVDNENVKNEKGLLQFNLSDIPSSAIITSAILNLYQTTSTNTFNVLVYRINNSWNEGTGTGTGNSGAVNGTTWDERFYGTNWNNAGGDYVTTIYANESVNTTDGVRKNWNITTLVQGWVNGTWPNYGLILVPEGTSGSKNERKFASRNDGDSSRWPLLTVYYTVSVNDTTPPATITNLANKSAGTTWIYWNWTNPADADFNKSILYLNEINIANTSNNYYNATNLFSGVNYTLGINTIDTSNNTNYTNVSSTARTISIPVTVINESSSNSTGTTLNTTLTLIAENGTTVYNNTNLTHTSITIQSGLYTVIVKPINYSISQIVMTQVYIGANTSKIVDFDSFNMANTSKAFAINPYVNFTSAEITLTAVGTDLFKCTNWNFTSQNCTDNNWVKILDIVPGKNYTFIINAIDPGFIETNQTKYYFHNESDPQYTSYQQLKNITTELGSIQSSGVSLANPLGVKCWTNEWITSNFTTLVSVNGTWNFTVYFNRTSGGTVAAYLFGRIFKINNSGSEIEIVNSTNSTNVGGATTTATAFSWNYLLPSTSMTNLSIGERIGVQICINLTQAAGGKLGYIWWENNTMSNVIIPVTQYDDIPPAINFTAPTETSGSYASRRYVLANVTANDSLSGLKNITIYLYNSSRNLINSTNSTASSLFINFSVSADGIYYFNATACDNATNCNSTETRDVTVDITPPAISIVSPANTTYNNRTQLVNISASDTNLASRWFFNGTTNETYTIPVLRTFAEGNNTLIAYANDTAGNMNSTSVVFTTDTIAPAISIVSPENTTYNNATILVNISSNGNNIWYNLNGNNITYSLDYVTFNKGSNTLYAFANDTAGNLNLTSVTFFINSAPSISLDSPANNAIIIDNQTVIFNFTATDDINITLNCSIYLDNILNQTNSTTKNGTVTYFTINGISYLTHTWYINCSDGALSNISEVRTFSITDIPPIFYLVSQADRQYNQTQNVSITASVNKNSTVVANASWDSTSQLVNLTYNGTNWWYNGTFASTLYPGNYAVNITATSVYGSVNSTLTNFTINDVTAPFVGQMQPSGQTYKGNTIVNISANASDYYYANLATVKANVSWDSTSQIINLTYNSGTGLFNGTFSNTAANGTYQITIIATDNAGNVNNTVTGNFLIDTLSPSLIGTAGPAAGTQYNQSQTVPFSINVSESSTVSANVSWDSTSQIVNMIYSSQWFYNSTFTSTLYPGTYNANISATDNVGNVNSTTTNFVVNDVTAPLIDLVLECQGYVILEFNQSCMVLIAANVTDPYYNSIDKVWANITWSSGSQIKNMTYNATKGRYEASFYNGLIGTYNITVYANDTFGNINSSQTSYYLNDSTPPLIINVNATKLNNTAAQVNWDTDEASDSIINYGTTTALGSNASDASLVYSHIIIVGNLNYGQLYYYNVTSCDINNNCRISGYHNFTITDITPPQITNYSISSYAPVINKSIFINATATDDLAVSGIFANITLPDGSVITLNVPGYFNISLAGRHNITIWANDTSGNTATPVSDYFIAGQNTSVQFNVIDNTLSGISSNLTIYLAGTTKVVHEHDFTGSKVDEHAAVLYDLLFKTYNESAVIKLLNINISIDSNRTLGVDKTTTAGYLITYGINSTYISSQNATITISYSGTSYSNEDALSVEKCSGWVFAARSCNSNWVSISAVQNKPQDTFTFNVTLFSAFSIKEAAPTPAVPSTGGGMRLPACKEKWQCNDWEQCENGIIRRSCTDLNNCGTEENKPQEAGSCISVREKCFDGIQNQDESDIDCGGRLCKTCDTGKKCASNRDCKSTYCYAGSCNLKEIDTTTPKTELPAPPIFSWMNYLMIYALLLIFLAYLFYKITPIVIGYAKRIPKEKEVGLSIESKGRPIMEIRANAEEKFVRPMDKVFGFVPRKMAEAEEDIEETGKKFIRKTGKAAERIKETEEEIKREILSRERKFVEGVRGIGVGVKEDVTKPVKRILKIAPEKFETAKERFNKSLIRPVRKMVVSLPQEVEETEEKALEAIKREIEQIKGKAKKTIGARERWIARMEKRTIEEANKEIIMPVRREIKSMPEKIREAEKETKKAIDLFKEKHKKLSLEKIAKEEEAKLAPSPKKPIEGLERFDDIEVPRPSVIEEEKDIKKELNLKERRPVEEILEETKAAEFAQKPKERQKEIKKEMLGELKEAFG